MELLNKQIKAGSQFKKNGVLFYLLSFFIPFLVIILTYIALHIAPFGEHNLAISDGKAYTYGLTTFGRLITGQEDFLYSFHGLGGNRWSGLAWGGLAPAKLLAVFATMETAPNWLAWISAVNLSLCGLAMYILLADIRGHQFSNLIFSTSYAMIGFNVVNCYQMLFFIGPQMLPLMTLGLRKLMKGQSPLVYILSLGICIFFNFYFGFHLCVASLMFFMAYLYVHSKQMTGRKGKVFGIWLGSSAIAGFLSAFMWLPALKAYSGGGRLNQTGIQEFIFKENMPFIQIFSKLFSGANSTSEMVNGLPNIFCGIIVVALVVLFFMNKKMEVRKKRAAGFIISFYLLTFYITAFTLAMHGGTHTNWFPYRYSYVFSFILILIASEEYGQLDSIELGDTKRCVAGLLIATALVFSTHYDYISGGAVVLDFTILFIMGAGFWLYKTKPERATKKALACFLLLLVCGNLYANFILSIYKVYTKQGWVLDLNEYREHVLKYGSLIDAVQTADQDFYRMEKDESDSGSVGADPGFYNYYGVSGSGPSIRAFINKELCKIGINWYDMRHWYSEGVPAATDSLLGLRYLVSDRDLTEEKGYENRISFEGMSIFQSRIELPISILSNNAVGSLSLGENVFDNLNTIWKSMTGKNENIFTTQEDITYTLKNATAPQSITSKELRESVSSAEEGKESEYNVSSIIEYTFDAEKDGPVYVFDTSIPESPNGLEVPAIRYVGYYRKGDTVTGKFTINGGEGTGDLMRGYCVNQVFAYADNEILAEYAELLNNRNININMEKESHLFGSFNAEKNQRILFTIPWDEGWTCYVDGQKVPIDKTWNLFMSVEVPEGEHTWEMRFFPAWMDYGLVISGIALVGLVVFMILWNKNNKKTAAVSAETVNANELISDTLGNTGAAKAETLTAAVSKERIENDGSEASK